MLNKKRGQVTIFVALGVILAVALILAIAFRGDIAKIVTEGAAESKTGFSAQVEDVRSHITDCLETSLADSTFILANQEVEDYDKELANEVEIYLGQCLDLKSFNEVTVRKLTEPKVTIRRDQADTLITATLNLEISIEKGENSEQLTEFIAEESLKEKICVLKTELDSQCRAKEKLTAGGFIFQQGEEVKIGGECLEC